MKTLKHFALIPIFFLGLQTSAQDNKRNHIKRFQQIDADKNEIITIRELIKFYKGKTNKNGAVVDAELMFYGLDKDNNSIITFREYAGGVDWKRAKQHKNIKSREALKSNNLGTPAKNYNTNQVNKFTKIDADNNNELSLKEMLYFHEGKTNNKGKPFKADLLFYGLDSNVDNRLTLDEFIKKPNWKAANKRKETAIKRGETRKQIKQIPKEKRKINRQKKKAAKQIIAPEKPKLETKSIQETTSSSDQKLIVRFGQIDKNNSKDLSLEEMIDFHKNKTNKNGKPVASELMFYGLDTDDNGKLTIGEFTRNFNWSDAKQKMKAKKENPDY